MALGGRESRGTEGASATARTSTVDIAEFVFCELRAGRTLRRRRPHVASESTGCFHSLIAYQMSASAIVRRVVRVDIVSDNI